MNWASWCFKLLIDGIRQFKSLGHGGVTGCVFFLQIFYLHHIKWNTLLVDRSKIPITTWTNDIIKKFTKWLQQQGGLESTKLSSHCINVVKIDGGDNSKFNVGDKVEIHPAMKIMMNNDQNILHIMTSMKTNGEDAANMAANKSRVDDGGFIVEEINHNFVNVSSKDDKSISKANKKIKSFSPSMIASSQNHDEQLMRNMVDGIQKKTDLLFPPFLFDPKFVDKPPKFDSRIIPMLVDESHTGLISGMAQGTTSLVSNTVYALSDAATQFSKAAHKGIVAFTFDDQAVARMEKQQKGVASHGTVKV
ncbi:hypothetical protein Dsin_017917 [Dipteronia sinensis]|uniref:Uncharacterized protein n=1 Tax=Dipteronia sinensis TaxID=43782 RepID=A0AAE0AGF7_9ROSI|nr:hypothetical protein Dsin_017917 [Dipteronia sinensis]